MRATFAMLAILATTAAFAAPGDSARLDACRDKLKKAQKPEVLYDMKWEAGKGPRVLVGPTYHRIPFDAKEGFAEALNCFFNAGEQGKCMNFDLRDYRSGSVVHHFRNCRLKAE